MSLPDGANIWLIAITCLLFALLVWLDGKSNLPSEERHRQWVMPLASIVFCIVIVWRYGVLYQSFDSMYKGIVARYPWFSAIEVRHFVVCAFNFFALLLFVILKKIFLAVVGTTSEAGESALFAPLYRLAYRYDRDESKWVLRMRFTELRRAVKWMHNTAVVIALALLVATLRAPESTLFMNPFYPVFVALILGEVRYFFEGLNVREYQDLIGVDPDKAEQVRDYLALQKAVADNFPDRFLESHICATPKTQTVSSDEFVEGLKASADYEERLAGEYVGAVYSAMLEWFSSTKKSDEEQVKSTLFTEADFKDTFKIEVDQVKTMIKMLKHQNVIFSTPFFRDFREFFFFPVNRSLMQGHTVLVLDCQGTLESVGEWVEEGLHAASSVPGLWSVGDLAKDKLPNTLDVGILATHHLNDFGFLDMLRPFLKKVGFVIALHPSCMLASTQIGLSRLVNLLPATEEVTWAVFDMNVDGLVDSLSHAANSQFVEVMATPRPSLINCGIIWDAEGESMNARMFDDVSHYLGIGTEISAFTLRMGADHVEWVAGSTVPLRDARWIASQYHQQIDSYAEIPHSQTSLESAIEFNWSLWDTPTSQHGYYVVEDEFANLLEMQRQYSTRSGESSMVHVISGNYLLRDFMRYNSRALMSDSRAISLVVADFEQSLRNYLIELLLTLIHEEVDTGEAQGRLRVIGVDVELGEVFDFCCEMIDEFALIPGGRRAKSYIQTTPREVFDEDTLEVSTREFLWVSADARAELVERTCYLRNSHYIAEDEVEKDRELGSCLFGQIQQRYLPGQFITIQGKYYEVLSVTPDSGVRLRRAGDHFERRTYYRQVKDYAIGNCREAAATPEDAQAPSQVTRPLDDALMRRRLLKMGDSSVEIAMCVADIQVRTLGYLRMADYADVVGASFVGLEDDSANTRSYTQKKALRITFPGVTQTQLVTVAALLNELCRTIFACDYAYLTVAPLQDESFGDYGEMGLTGVVQRLVADADDETVKSDSLYVIEDSLVDIGLVSAFERNAERLMSLVYHFLRWHASMLEKGPVLDRDGRYFVSPEHLLGRPSMASREKETIDLGDASAGLGGPKGGPVDDGEVDFVEPVTEGPGEQGGTPAQGSDKGQG